MEGEPMDIEAIIAADPRLNAKQAAAYLGAAPETLATWRCRGGGPQFIKIGASVRYLKSDLDAWMNARKVSFYGQLAERE